MKQELNKQMKKKLELMNKNAYLINLKNLASFKRFFSSLEKRFFFGHLGRLSLFFIPGWLSVMFSHPFVFFSQDMINCRRITSNKKLKNSMWIIVDNKQQTKILQEKNWLVPKAKKHKREESLGCATHEKDKKYN